MTFGIRSLASFILSAVLVSSCATKTRVETVRVSVPIPVACSVDPGPEPDPIWTEEARQAAPNLFVLGSLLLAAFEQERARNRELKAALAGCGG